MLGALVQVSCGTLIKDPVTINDEALYYLKEASPDQWAVEMHFLTSGQTQVTQAQWNAMSQGMVAMPLTEWDDINTEIGKLCSQVPCDYNTTQALSKLMTQLHSAANR
jgi:hypothetical protein